MNPPGEDSLTLVRCPCCQAPIPAGAPAGVCPQCELQGALEVLATPAPDTEEGGDAYDGEESEASLQRFGGYELLEEIARGGMGVVYRARQRSLDRVVALKMLLGGALASREFIQRFRTEAAAAASLKHPNIVAIHEVGFQGGQHFFAMDFVAGRTLAEAIGQQPLDTRRAATILETVAEAVHHAHEHGILHRDLKPSNVILDAEDQPHVMDFGLAKRLTDQTEVTLSVQTLGSPNYMPPEQAASDRGKISRRSDVYALGAMFYHTLTGRPPFVGGTLAETLRAVLEAEPVRPRLLHPAVPLDLETICLKCLEKDPARRYATAQELADELGRWLRGEPIRARAAGRISRLWRWCRRKPALAASLSAILLLLVVIAIGSTAAAWRLKRQEQALRESLGAAYLSEAQLRRSSGQVGQRFHALDDLARAAAVLPAQELAPPDRGSASRNLIRTRSPLRVTNPRSDRSTPAEPVREVRKTSLALRNDAIAAMALPDLREVGPVECPPGHALTFDAAGATFVECPLPGRDDLEAVIRRTGDRAEIARVPLTANTGGVLLSPDGRFLVAHSPASAATARLQVWDVVQRTVAFDTEVPARGRPVEFHPDGRLAAFARPDGALITVDLTARRVLAGIPIGFPANALCFQPGGPGLAAARLGQSEVVVVDRERSREIARLPQHGPASGGLDWNAEGNRLAVGCTDLDGGQTVQLWAWKEGQGYPYLTLRGHGAPVFLARFLPGTDLLLTSAYEPSARFWSITTGRQLLVTPHHPATSAVRGTELVFQQDARTYTRQRLVLGAEYRLLHGPRLSPAHSSVDFSPRAPMIASASVDGVRLWHLPTGRPLGVLPVGQSLSALFHPVDGSLFIAAGEEVTRWPVALSPGGETITVGPPEIALNRRPRSHGFRLAFDRAGSRLAATANDRTEVIELQRPEPIRSLPHGEIVAQTVLSPDGAWGVNCSERFVVWQLATGERVRELPGGGYPDVAFSPDGRWVVFSFRPRGSGDGVHRLCRVGGWETEREFAAVNTGWNVSAFSPDSRLLALRSSSSGVLLLDTHDWTEIATLDVPEQQMIFDLAFSPDGTRLGIACESRLVQYWDLREVRSSLAALGLDWNHPPYPSAAPTATLVPRLAVKSNRDPAVPPTNPASQR